MLKYIYPWCTFNYTSILSFLCLSAPLISLHVFSHLIIISVISSLCLSTSLSMCGHTHAHKAVPTSTWLPLHARFWADSIKMIQWLIYLIWSTTVSHTFFFFLHILCWLCVHVNVLRGFPIITSQINFDWNKFVCMIEFFEETHYHLSRKKMWKGRNRAPDWMCIIKVACHHVL